MRRLDLDYLRTTDSPRWAGWALLVLGALAIVAVNHHAGLAGARLEALGAQLAAATRSPAATPAASGDTALAEVRAAYAVAQRLTMPWDTLFEALERAQTAGIRLTAIQPDAQARSAHIGGEASDYVALLNYIAALETRGGLQRAHLVAHEPKPGAGGTLVFSAQARWAEPHTAPGAQPAQANP